MDPSCRAGGRTLRNGPDVAHSKSNLPDLLEASPQKTARKVRGAAGARSGEVRTQEFAWIPSGTGALAPSVQHALHGIAERQAERSIEDGSLEEDGDAGKEGI